MRQEHIKYLRHPNGRGRLYDDSDVSKGSYLSIDSIAAGNCVIRGGRVHGRSLITDRALVTGGDISNVIVKDYGQIYDNPILEGPLVVAGSARVYGDAHLHGSMVLDGKMRVNTGYWTRAPRYVDLGFESVTESKLGAMVGCRDRSVDYWLRHGPKLALRWGMTKEQVKQLIEAVREVSSD